MSDLVRFGVAMDRGLLERFDRRIAERGYENRSEALRDLVRAELTRAGQESGRDVAGTISLVCSRSTRHELTKLVEGLGSTHVLASQSVPLDSERSLEVLVVRGRAAELGELAGRLGGARGVYASELSVAAVEAEDDHQARHDGRENRR